MFVTVMVLIDITILMVYTILEGFVDNFGVLSVPNKERPFIIIGVSSNGTQLMKSHLIFTFCNLLIFVIIGTCRKDNILHLPLFNEIMDKILKPRVALWLQMHPSDICSLLRFSNSKSEGQGVK